MRKPVEAVLAIAVVGYSLVAFLFAVSVIAVAFFFIGDIGMNRSVDRGLLVSQGRALKTDLALIALFALQHSLMARSWFKRLWSRSVPYPVERSTYVLLASLALALMIIFWLPVTDVIWTIDQPVVRSVFWLIYGIGWTITTLAIIQMEPLEQFGLSQALSYCRGLPQQNTEFKAPGLYRFSRHPQMLGTIILVWAAPTMTLGRFLLASGFTVYILLGVTLEERLLIREFGSKYLTYRRRVNRLIPFPPFSSHPID